MKEPTKPAIAPRTLAAARLAVNKQWGKNTVTAGDELMFHAPKLSTGVFMSTYCMGGGYPVGFLTRLKGPESGGKSTLCLDAMRSAAASCWRCFNIAEFCTCSLPPLRMRSVFADPENTFERAWAEAIKVPSESYEHVLANDGQEYLDICELMLGADDCGLLIVDSIAMLLPPVEVSRSIGDNKIASHAALITGMVNRFQTKLGKERKRGHPCMVLATNQLRSKVGVQFGNPESETGGHAWRHLFVFGLRISKVAPEEGDKLFWKGEVPKELEEAPQKGKQIFEEPEDEGDRKKKNKKVNLFESTSRKMRLVQRHNFTIDKNKKYMISPHGSFLRVVDNVWDLSDPPNLLHPRGSIVDQKQVINYAKRHGLLEKVKEKYRIKGLIDKVDTQEELLTMLKTNLPLYYQLQKVIADTARKQAFGE
jgi:RecA/RadA recombinase